MRKDTRNLAPFEQIELDGAYSVKVQIQEEQKFEIESDENIIPFVTLEVKENVLRVYSTKRLIPRKGITLTISVPKLTAVSMNGSCVMEVAGIKDEVFKAGINGSATLTVSGQVQKASIISNGVGYIDTTNLDAASVDIDVNGVGDAKVKAKKAIDAKISGAGKVEYFGNPQTVKEKISGSGTIVKQ
jgi:hypothetical protein